MNWGLECNYNIKSPTTALLKIVRNDCQFAQWALSHTWIVDTTKSVLSILMEGKLADRDTYQSQFVNTRNWSLVQWFEVYHDTEKTYTYSSLLNTCVHMVFKVLKPFSASSRVIVRCISVQYNQVIHFFPRHLRIGFNQIGFLTFTKELVKCPQSWEIVLFIETHYLHSMTSP